MCLNKRTFSLVVVDDPQKGLNDFNGCKGLLVQSFISFAYMFYRENKRVLFHLH